MLFQSAESRYNQWVREHYRFLLRSAWAMTGSRAIAEDVVQDCFANAWKHREQLRNAAWRMIWNSQARASAASRNCSRCFQIMRRAAFRQAVPGMPSLDDEEQPERAAPDAGLDDKIDVVKALARLAPIHREVLVLFYFDDMPTAQMPRRWRSRLAPCCHVWPVRVTR